MLIDTHAHLNFNAYKEDSDEVIRRSLGGGVWMINVGSQYKTSVRAVEIAQKYEKGVYAAIGLHPIHLAEGIFKTKIDMEEIAFKTNEESFDYERYKELSKNPKVVAIGEIGLDYWYKPKTTKKIEEFKEKQKAALLEQLKLAEELNLPVIFHCRAAHEDLITILNTRYKIQNTRLRGVVHCYTGTWEQAEKYLEMGFYIGFNGIIFKLDLDEVIRKTPMERILLETDCPYLIPPSVAEVLTKATPSVGRNEPLYVKYVAERIAQIKKIEISQIHEATTLNAKYLFGIE